MIVDEKSESGLASDGLNLMRSSVRVLWRCDCAEAVHKAVFLGKRSSCCILSLPPHFT